MTAVDATRLRRAFELSGLERLGWTFERAMQCENLAWSINRRAKLLRNDPTPGGSVPRNWNGSKPAHMLRQHGDTLHCSCGKQFDVNDPEAREHE